MLAKAEGGAPGDDAPYYPPGSPQRKANLNAFLQDSAVPHPVYHGSWADVHDFVRTGRMPGFTDIGHWFSSNPQEASAFAGAGFSDKERSQMHPTSGAGSIYPTHLSIKNPLEFPDAKSFWDWAKDYALFHGHGQKTEKERNARGDQWTKADPEKIRERLILAKKDGIIIRGGGEADNFPTKGDWFIALHPHQIKSALGNRGTYDPNEADIGKAEGGAVKSKEVKRALMIARDQRALLRRVANIYPGPAGGMDPSPRGGGYSGPGGGKYIGPSHYADGGKVDHEANKARFLEGSKAPPRLYHGTVEPKDFSVFGVGQPHYAEDEHGEGSQRQGSGPDPTTYLGSHFAEEPEVANKFARGLYGERKGATSGNRVYPVHLAVKNPHVTTEKEMHDWMLRQSLWTPWVEQLLNDDAETQAKYEKYPVYRRLINMSALEHENEADEPTYETAQEMARKLRDYLITKGHDGIKYQNKIEGGTSWIAFDPRQIKSAIGNRGTYDPDDPDMGKSEGGYIGRATGGKVPPFKLYSGAAKIIGAKGQKKATPQQYAAMPGIKPDELKYSKFDTLGSKALPREEVIKHLEDNRLPIEETQLGGEGRNTSTKFHGPKTTLPGGKNYREVLLHLPVTHTPSPELGKARERADAATRAYDDALSDQLSNPNASEEDYRRASTEADAARIALSRLERADRDTAARAGFRGGHWEEPDVLAHVRMSDRKGPNGEKVLHVEEVQSDWGQQGRDQGFARDPDELKQAVKARDDYVAGLPARVRAEIDRRIEKARSAGTPVDTVTADQIVEELTQDPFGAARFLGETDKHNEMRNAAMPSRDLKPQTPRGPYVDNTQKWTDLALKRVLHEAAHGGYDKIVVTPGDEQNKRYDLSSQVKNIQYYPDIGYLHATTHDDEGVDHNDVKPEDLSKHIGKEAADRIMKQGMQRYEGRGRLGGEFYHELEGDGLKMGGAGMRGYYDNILPKRLQALAQQHDPQAKVNLHAHDLAGGPDPAGVKRRAISMAHNTGDIDQPTEAAWNAADPEVRDWHTEHATAEQARIDFDDGINHASAPLHSLDVTPQMRDSIKANGFNSFKRGGEVDDDPIKDWQWRPTEDVRNELQLDEIPSHVHKFGEFMDETARRAATQGLTPRDLIKAYAITRSSIGRGALPVATVRRPKNPAYGFDALPEDTQGSLRPEGAMGHWLHTKMGQRYLDEAEAGRVDEEAVRDAIKSMGAFGLPESAEGKALRWAPKNLPGQEGRVSELIARAHRGQSSPEEWRKEMRVPGIAESKAGFFASMLGRGDQPTLDARQIILNTGQSTKKAAPHLSPKGAKEAAVNRLAGRQTELGLKHDKSMSPFYQHLTHHAIWDKTGGEETTHDDLMQALRGAKDGGRQGYAKGGGDKPLSLIEGHPVVQGLSMALPPEAELQQLLRKAGIVRPYNQPSQANVERALEIAKTYAMPLGVGSKDDPSAYYGVKQPTAARDVTTKAGATAGFSLKPEKAMSWKEFGAIGKGGHVVNLSGDRTRFGTLHEINGQPLNWPVKVYAGPDYIREPVKGRAWASAPGVISGLNRTVTDLSKKGPVFGMYSPYGATGGDFAHHMFDAVMAQVNPDQISKSAKKKFDAAMRDASFIMGQTDKDKSKRERVKPRMEDWPGVDDPKAASEFARKNLTGDHRKAILEYLDKKSWTDEGFPHVGMTRVAVTDPKLLGVPQNVIGGNVALLTPSDTPLSSKHPSYSAGQPGEYVGTLPFAPRHYALPVTTGHFVKTPSAGKGVYVDPYSLNDRARGGYRTLFERNYVPEPVSNQMAEGAEEGIRKMPLYGLKRGGSVSRALDIARKINGR